MDEYKETRQKYIDEQKITVKSVFVPFSQSRNAKNKHYSLNWKVTVYSNCL